MSSLHKEEEHSKAEELRFEGALDVFEDFRRSVADIADVVVDAVAAVNCQSEIQQQGLIIFSQQYVLRLEIAVQNVFVLQVAQGSQHAFREISCCVFSKGPTSADILQQIAMLVEGHDDQMSLHLFGLLPLV